MDFFARVVLFLASLYSISLFEVRLMKNYPVIVYFRESSLFSLESGNSKFAFNFSVSRNQRRTSGRNGCRFRRRYVVTSISRSLIIHHLIILTKTKNGMRLLIARPIFSVRRIGRRHWIAQNPRTDGINAYFRLISPRGKMKSRMRRFGMWMEMIGIVMMSWKKLRRNMKCSSATLLVRLALVDEKTTTKKARVLTAQQMT